VTGYFERDRFVKCDRIYSMKDKNNIYNLSNVVNNFLGIQQVEKDLEDMIKDNILDIYVDDQGKFFYKVNDATYNTLTDNKITLERKMISFEDMLANRGLSVKMYKNFYDPKKFKM